MFTYESVCVSVHNTPYKNACKLKNSPVLWQSAFVIPKTNTVQINVFEMKQYIQWGWNTLNGLFLLVLNLKAVKIPGFSQYPWAQPVITSWNMGSLLWNGLWTLCQHPNSPVNCWIIIFIFNHLTNAIWPMKYIKKLTCVWLYLLKGNSNDCSGYPLVFLHKSFLVRKKCCREINPDHIF